jgi:hypothetical protein
MPAAVIRWLRRALPWLLPIAALILACNSAKVPPLKLPYVWSVAVIVSSVAIGMLAWLLVIRPRIVERLALGVGLVAAIVVLFVAARPTAHDIWTGPGVHPGPTTVAAIGAAAAVAAGLVMGRRRRGLPQALDVLVGIVLVSFVLTDLVQTHSVFQRDYSIYLDAGRDFRAGNPVYLASPLHVAPKDPTNLPFLYPPVVLPLFAVLGAAPPLLASGLWLVLQVPAALYAIRSFGVSWGWALLLMVWPPFVQGIWVGNVAIWMVLCFALVPRLPVLAGVPSLFKFQTALIGLWLLRERRWRGLVAAGALVAGLGLVTLPLVGIELWRQWVHGLIAFQDSLTHVPQIRGVPVSRYIGAIPALILGGLFVLLAFRLRAGRSLAALGQASVAVSPTLYLHGVTLSLPSFLSLRAGFFWLAILVGASSSLVDSLWVVMVVCLVAAYVPVLRHAPGSADATWQPLGPKPEPWADATAPDVAAPNEVPTAVPAGTPDQAGTEPFDVPVGAPSQSSVR